MAGLNQAEAVCRERAAPPGAGLYYATRHHPEAVQQRLHALFALYFEVLDVFLLGVDPGVTQIKLQWWREELQRLQAGEPRHPITRELARALQPDAAAQATLSVLPDAVALLFIQDETEDLPAWRENPGLDAFWQLAVSAAGGSPPILSSATLLARLEQLQYLRLLLRMGYRPLPRDLLQAHGLHVEALLENPAADPVKALLAELVEAIRSGLDQAYREQRRRLPLFAAVLNRLGAATCEEIRRDGHALLQRRVALTPLRRLWIATRTRYARHLP